MSAPFNPEADRDSLTVEAAGAADTELLPLRKLTREQARAEQRAYWMSMSVAERLAASTALTKRLYTMRGIDLDERKADLTPRRIPRRQS